ncbi:hypothetical protein K432DRAFT_294522, partial [Lepidopterella palustris CBS 459.81]
NFVFDLHFYDIPINKNGKMTLKGYDFVLEEGRDSGHGTGGLNIVRTWKKNHGLELYSNCYNSPNLPPIKNCWEPPKQYIGKIPHQDEQETHE